MWVKKSMKSKYSIYILLHIAIIVMWSFFYKFNLITNDAVPFEFPQSPHKYSTPGSNTICFVNFILHLYFGARCEYEVFFSRLTENPSSVIRCLK